MPVTEDKLIERRIDFEITVIKSSEGYRAMALKYPSFVGNGTLGTEAVINLMLVHKKYQSKLWLELTN